MRSVGQVLLAVALVAGAGIGAITAVGIADSSFQADSQGSGAVHAANETPTAVLSLFDGPTTGDWHPRSQRLVDSSRRHVVEGERSSATAPANGAGPASVGVDEPATQVTAPSDSDVELTQEFRRTPQRLGRVRVTQRYSIADRIVDLRTSIPQRGAVIAVDGFSPVNETIYRWDGATASPSVTYSLSVNETGSRVHARANGSLLFADAGEWALLRRPSVSTTWSAYGRMPVSYDLETVTAGSGAVGDSLVFLGDVRVHSRTGANQTFRLAVPEAANVTESPDDILDAMERASASLAVGDRDAVVFAVAAPTDGVPWAVRGLSIGDSDFWVEADERLGTTDNIWIHEYVHTRQDYRPTTTTEWTVEAFPTYYAAYHAFRYDSVTFEAFADALSLPANRTANATLSDPATWGKGTAYERGSLVAGQMDRRLRSATDGNRTIDSVLAAMNEAPGDVNASEFFDAVAGPGNLSVRATMRPAVYANRSISMWDRSQHVDAFGAMPARVVAATPRGDGTYRVRGPYRNATLDGAGSYTIVTGESIVGHTRVRNLRNVSGYYDVALRVNGSVVDAADGPIPARDVATAELGHTFASPGAYRVRIGNETASVVVRRPVRASVVGVAVTPDTVSQYQRSTVSVTVRNDAPIPASRELRIRRGNATVATLTVNVGPNATVTRDVSVQFPRAGPTTVGVDGNHSVDVAVESSSPPQRGATPTPTDSSGDSRSGVTGPGFGVATALVAVVVAALVTSYVRR